MGKLGVVTVSKQDVSGGGPYSFRIQNELHHYTGTLLSNPGAEPVYAQLYIYDSATALNHCMQNTHNQELNHYTMKFLQDLLTQCNPYVTYFKHAYEILSEQPQNKALAVKIHFPGIMS